MITSSRPYADFCFCFSIACVCVVWHRFCRQATSSPISAAPLQVTTITLHTLLTINHRHDRPDVLLGTMFMRLVEPASQYLLLLVQFCPPPRPGVLCLLSPAFLPPVPPYTCALRRLTLSHHSHTYPCRPPLPSYTKLRLKRHRTTLCTENGRRGVSSSVDSCA